MFDSHSLLVKSWAQYDRKIRLSGRKLLGQLDKYDDAILVAGCQRSGTTALSRLITCSEGMVRFQFGKDDELDAALILTGWVDHKPRGRYCFQTTYLNDSYHEYFEHRDYKLIWVLRNPLSVINSMLHNWKITALNRLFRHCGYTFLREDDKKKFRRFGVFSIPQLQRACLSYNAKISQTSEISRKLDGSRLLVIDYDELVRNKYEVLPAVYRFLSIPFRLEYVDKMHSGSINKAEVLSERSAGIIEATCMPTYAEARKYLSNLDAQSNSRILAGGGVV